MKSLKTKDEFDVLVIGGGATGAGAALDAALRGLKVACVEREDFSCRFAVIMRAQIRFIGAH
jgi:glycerol-3-phosphate dehydrogenase